MQMERKYSFFDLIENECNNLKISCLGLEANFKLESTLSSEYFGNNFQYTYYESASKNDIYLYYCTFEIEKNIFVSYLSFIREKLYPEPNDFGLKLFLGFINPTLLLNGLDKDWVVENLLKGEKIYIVTDNVDFVIEVVHDDNLE